MILLLLCVLQFSQIKEIRNYTSASSCHLPSSVYPAAKKTTDKKLLKGFKLYSPSKSCTMILKSRLAIKHPFETYLCNEPVAFGYNYS